MTPRAAVFSALISLSFLPACAQEGAARLMEQEILAAYSRHCDRLAVPTFTSEDIARYGRPRVVDERAWGSHRVADVDGPARMFIEVRSGELKMFHNRRSDRKPFGEEYSYSSKIDSEEAEERAWKYLRQFEEHMPANLWVRKIGFGENVGTWFAGFRQSYRAFPKDGGVRVEFDDDGNVLVFNDSTRVCDCPTRIRVSWEDAIAAGVRAAQRAVRMYDWLEGYDRVSYMKRRDYHTYRIWRRRHLIEIVNTNSMLLPGAVFSLHPYHAA